MLKPIKIRKGLDIKLPGAPQQSIRPAGPVTSLALSGADLGDVRPSLHVRLGDRVRSGEILFHDAARPPVVWTAPSCGVVSQLSLGRRRMLDLLVIDLEDGEPKEFDLADDWAAASARQLLLDSGAWVALRTRPFGLIPDPDATADAIFVNAMDSQPLAADPNVVLAEQMQPFRSGLEILKRLGAGLIFVCQSADRPLVDEDQQLRCVAFAGPHPAGLPGTHINALMPVSSKRQVWQIDYQEVIAIGHLCSTGRVWAERVIALAGSGVLKPSLLRTVVGARIDHVTHGQLAAGPLKVVSGSVLDGRVCPYLGRFHRQISVLKSPVETGLWSRLLARLPSAPAGPMIPLATLDSLLPIDVLPTPLLRALSVGDVDRAEALGCVELLEEDLALLSYQCVGKTDYGALLRQVLDQLAADRQ